MKKVSLKNISTAIQYGFTESATSNAVGPKFLRITDIQDGNVDWGAVPYCICNEVEKFKLSQGDIVFARTGATTGKSYLIENCPEAVFASYLIRVRVKDYVYPKYVYYFFQSESYWSQVRSGITGSTQGGLNATKLSELVLPLPDLQTQKQIAQVLEAADCARQQRKAANALTEQFLQSSFVHLFGDPVQNEIGWEVVKIRDVASEAKYGTSKPSQSDGVYPYLRMNNITYDGRWNFSDLKFISLEENEKDKYLIKRGDLIFNRTNSKELVGKTAVYNRNEEMAIAGYLIRVRLNERAVPEYVSGYLNSSFGKELLKSMCKNIIGMANINAQELQNISLPLPPLALQQHFASIVADAEILRQKQQESEKELEHLFQALLQQYFGESASYAMKEETLSIAAEEQATYSTLQ